jgi:hypothetical protein
MLAADNHLGFAGLRPSAALLIDGDCVDGAAMLRLHGSHGFFQGFHFGSELVGLAFQAGVLCFHHANFVGISLKPHVLRFERIDLRLLFLNCLCQ